MSAEMSKLEELLRIVQHLEEGVGKQEDQTHHHHDYQQNEDHPLQVVLLLHPVYQF